jgi:glutamyl-tRNA synthetase
MAIKLDEKKILAYALKNAIEHEGKAQAGSVLSPLFCEGLEKNNVKEIMPIISKILKQVNSMEIEEQKEEFEKLQKLVSHREVREGLPELNDIPKSGIITRFAPSPSGPMHIGHAATGILSSLYVKKYGGKFYLRIEDTNPENIDACAYKMLPEEADWLFGNVTAVIIQSDRIKKYYDFAEKIIEKNFAYVCDCDPEKFKKLLDQGKSCPCRNLPKEKSMERWKKMLDKSSKGYKEGQAVLRFKSDLNDPNPALRDFPLARIKEEKHPRQGKKYRVWPLMNLCVTLDDMEFNTTHAIRAKDHMDNAKRQAMIFKIFSKKIPNTYFLGRYNFTDLEISCTKTKEKIEQGKFCGWDDICLPFIAALRKRGYQAESFAKMAEKRGLSEVDKVISKEDYFQELNMFNRELIKDKAVQASLEQQKKKSKGSIEILMPDASVIYADSDINLKKLKDGQLAHFLGFGYCCFNPKEKIKFWFAHK